LGRLVLTASTSGRLPVNLMSSGSLSNLDMLVDALERWLTDLSVETNVAGVCASGISRLSNSVYLLSLAACSNQWLYGTQQVAWLYVSAVSNQPSAFVPVAISGGVGAQPDGTLVTNYLSQAGRVVVIGEEPLLEASTRSNGQPGLTLYGATNWNHTLETAPELGNPAGWQPAWTNLHTTNLVRHLVPGSATNGTWFFRAKREP
jgi:hypothetical protein